MLRRTELKRSVPEYTRPPMSAPRPVRAVAPTVFSDRVATQAKDAPVRSESHRRAVAALPCFNCGVEGYSQAAHADEGKGLGLKSCDLTCYPLCCTRPGIPGCHYQIGTAGLFTRDQRRDFEKSAVIDTKEKLAIKK